jgi:ribonuclease Z
MLDLTGLAVRAVSVGGFETCIEIPAWKLCFDIGRCPPTAHACRTVLLTHAHVDHMGGIANHAASRDLLGMPPPTYVVPAEIEERFVALLDAWRRLSGSALPCTVIGARPGDRVPLGRGRTAIAFRAIHRVPTLGYAIAEARTRLRPELVGLSSEEIGERARRGEPVKVDDEAVRVAFCGDTTIDVLDREELPRKARLLVLEVTFVDDRVPTEQARRLGHVHLDELIGRLDALEAEVVLCTHPSIRHREDFARVLRSKAPDAWKDRLIPLTIPTWWDGGGGIRR